MKVGYVRVSSADQNTARQEKILAEMERDCIRERQAGSLNNTL